LALVACLVEELNELVQLHNFSCLVLFDAGELLQALLELPVDPQELIVVTGGLLAVGPTSAKPWYLVELARHSIPRLRFVLGLLRGDVIVDLSQETSR
jgi:hypothetical protein